MYRVEDITGLFFWSNPFMLLHCSLAAIPTKPIRFFNTKHYKNQKSQKMNSNLMARHISILFRHPNQTIDSMCFGHRYLPQQLQQWRGNRMKIRDGNLEQALTWIQPKMQSSGIKQLIRKQQTNHINNSEKLILAQKNLERKIKSQDLARNSRPFLSRKSGNYYLFTSKFFNLWCPFLF